MIYTPIFVLNCRAEDTAIERQAPTRVLLTLHLYALSRNVFRDSHCRHVTAGSIRIPHLSRKRRLLAQPSSMVYLSLVSLSAVVSLHAARCQFPQDQQRRVQCGTAV